MAQTKTAKAKDKFGGDQFPIHYERGGYLQVYTNPHGELFIEDLRTGISMRVNPSPLSGFWFTTEGRVEPIYVNGMIGWRVSPR